ncbi:MAG: NosD domain-containing protein [Candidatus Moranbacteria bacterium]|nr:NosD domain-containing protein [Candidatus Moranbacteria bacterium]
METFFTTVANSEFFRTHAAVWWGYFPLGVIGLWRWSVWGFKKITSFFYRLPVGEYGASVSIVTPVYNENPEMFRAALVSWKGNHPKEIIAVIDHTDTRCIEVFEVFSESCPEARMIITRVPGKREALATGIGASTGEIVALVDSDTIWTEGLKEKVTGPFSDARVGGVAPRQDVLFADTIARKLFRIHIFNRYGNDLVYQAAFGNALSCISGRTGVYRRSAIAHLTKELVTERFFGKKCISGDDKRLTSLVQRDGWDVKYVRTALVYTPGSRDMRTYTKQQIRWTRNSWRSDMKALFSGWLWKNPFLAFHTIDRFIQPFTLLLGPIFFGIALYRGDFIIAWILVCWWMISRALKVLPHFMKHPADVAILPIHVAYGFFLALIKIYTLVTVDEQTWITRWDRSRLNRLGFLRRASAYTVTVSIVVLLSFVGYQSSDRLSSRAQAEQRKAFAAQEKEMKRLFRVEDQSHLVLTNDQESGMRRESLSQKLDTDSFGYYRLKQGETYADVRRRFFLHPDSTLLPVEGPTYGPIGGVNLGERVAIAVNDLRNPDMERYRRNSTVGFVVVNYPKQNAIRISGKGSFVTIDDLAARIHNKAILENLGNKQFILRKNVFIDDGVTLIIDGASVGWLKLKSDANGFVWLKSENGNIVIRNTKVTSWDEGAVNYDMNWNDGRSYILQKLSGRMDIDGSELAYLGYFGSPNRGNPYGGPYGVSWKLSDGTFRDDLSTGRLTHSNIHHNLFGMYTFGATGIVLSDNDVHDNVEYGLDPHDDSNHLLIEGNRVFRNGNHGIILSRRCFSNIIRGNFSQDNRLHGIMLDRDSNNNLVENNYISGNVNGIVMYHSFENMAMNNVLSNNGFGIRINNESGNNFFGENVIVSNRKGIYFYQNSSDNYVFRNTFLQNAINVHLKQESGAFFVQSSGQEVLQKQEVSPDAARGAVL